MSASSTASRSARSFSSRETNEGRTNHDVSSTKCCEHERRVGRVHEARCRIDSRRHRVFVPVLNIEQTRN